MWVFVDRDVSWLNIFCDIDRRFLVLFLGSLWKDNDIEIKFFVI